MRLVDCFPYNGESIALFRIQYLYDIVDEFVVVEARETHSGQSKPSLFFEQNHEAFAPYLDKITFLILDHFPPPSMVWLQTIPNTYPWMKVEAIPSWWREMYQREYAETYLRNRYEGERYLAQVSDADEIPSREALVFARQHYDLFSASPVYLEMAFFYYNFRWQKRFSWHYAFLMNDQCLRLPHVTFNHARVGMPRERCIPHGGWHCSYFFSKADLRRKLQSFAHRECDKEEYKTDAYLQECLDLGLDIAGRREGEHCVPRNPKLALPQGWEAFQAELERAQQAQQA